MIVGDNMKKIIYFIAIIGIVLDQITKFFVNKFLIDLELIPHFFHLTYVENTGGAWGILDNNTFILICISVVTLLIINRYVNSDVKLTKLSSVSYGLLIGGIFGNLFDRIFRGYVVDFFNFNIWGYSFPVFNVADCLIVIGVIIMFIEVIGDFYENRGRSK